MGGCLTRILGRTPSGGVEPPWSGAPGFIGSGTTLTATPGASSGTFDVPYPASIDYHDILVMQVVANEHSSGTPMIATPSGWTLASSGNIGGSNFFRYAIFWKRADWTETGTQTVSFSGGGDAYLAKTSNFRGCVATGTPYEGLGTTTGTSINPVGPNVVTTGADRLVVDIISKQTTGSPTSTPGGGWTERYDIFQASNNAAVLDDIVQATAATVTGETSTSSASTRYRCVGFALLPR